ncbi:MAG: DJ-1 family glyoxalase III [Gammaproteobacteria bacterium]
MVRVLVPLAPGCEELEAVTIIDLLRRAGVEVTAASLDGGTVRASRGVCLVPDTSLEQALQGEFDMVVLPGGLTGAENLNADPRIHPFLVSMAEKGRYITAICAAPTVLGNAGLLAGKIATAYPGSLEALHLSGVTLSADPVVVDGTVVTSRGPGTAMDFALVLIEVLVGKGKRQEVEARLMRPHSSGT